MREIFRTANPADIAFIKSLFESADIPLFLFDEQASTMLVAWTSCRIMASDSDYDRALALLNSAHVVTDENA